MPEQKKLTRINIFHISTRKQDAEMLRLKYSSSGAEVTLIQVPDDTGTRLHIGKLYYFTGDSADKIFANSLALDLRDIELVYPHFVKLEQSQPIDFAVWIATKPKNRTSSIISNETVLKDVENLKSATVSQVPKISPSISTLGVGLVDCPKCNSCVRADRLERHIRKVHEKRSSYRNRSSYSYASSYSSGYVRKPCRHCGRPAISGDDTCYSCNPK